MKAARRLMVVHSLKVGRGLTVGKRTTAVLEKSDKACEVHGYVAQLGAVACRRSSAVYFPVNQIEKRAVLASARWFVVSLNRRALVVLCARQVMTNEILQSGLFAIRLCALFTHA
jgi:hypothetical protein